MRMMNRGFFVVENVDFNIKTSHVTVNPPPPLTLTSTWSPVNHQLLIELV